MRVIRIFVSSPTDAAHERRRVERVVERLNGQLPDDIRLAAIRWETQFYSAHDSFQPQIPEAADCDVVIAIFRSRLGTSLPDNFARMPTGERYPSGTAYEMLSAIEARKTRSLPDIYVFRHSRAPSVALDDPERATIQDQWARLEGFFERWFKTDGQFKAAFETYDATDGFEDRVEALLRRWIEDHVQGARPVAWSIALNGSPFRGLEAFGARHAQVFFGRGRDAANAVDMLKDASSAAGTRLPFLLLIGPSGAGKSSLVRAGIVPRVVSAGVVPDVDVWRTAVLRPGEAGGRPFRSLALRLFDDLADLPPSEAGRPRALPELAQGDYATPVELEGLLAFANEAAAKPILRALDRVAAAEQASAGADKPQTARLLLVVDQLDELFGPDVTAEDRAGFSLLLLHLAGTGRVWIVCTLRADLYELFSREPSLLELKKRGATYDVESPAAATLDDIVRKPAEAAGLVFEERALSNGSRQSLDERLIADATRPDMLPLIQFTLNRLFEARRNENGTAVLTHAQYDHLGGLDGAIAQVAEDTLATVDETARARLPRLLRQLVVGTDERTATGGRRLAARSVAYEDAAHARTLVDALIAGRILLGEGGDGATGQIRLAHQHVIEAWPRAREIVAQNADFYRIVRDVEQARVRWAEQGKPTDLLLRRGIELAEAESIRNRFADEIEPETRAFIAASRHRANRAQRVAYATAAVFALVAIGAGTAGHLAYQAEQRATADRAAAERNFALAKQTIDTSIVEFAQGFRGLEGIKGSVLLRVLASTRGAVERLADAAPDDADLQHSRLSLLGEFGGLLNSAGDRVAALKTHEEGLALARAQLKRDPGNIRWQLGVWSSLNAIGGVRLVIKDGDGAREALDESLSMAREMLARKPDDAERKRNLAQSLILIGDARVEGNDYPGATAAYGESLDIRRLLAARDPNGIDVNRDLGFGLDRMAHIAARTRDNAKALALTEEGVSLARDLVKRVPDNVTLQRDLAVTLRRIGDLNQQADRVAALAAYEESSVISRNLLRLDPENTTTLFDLGYILHRTGDMRRAAGDAGGTIEAYAEAAETFRILANRDPLNVSGQERFNMALRKIAEVRAALGESAEAIAAYSEIVTNARTQLRRHPDLRSQKVELVGALVGIARLTDDPEIKRSHFSEALAVMKALDERDELQPVQRNSIPMLEGELSKLPRN